jgi:predicted CXXCH cytochrome family protein
MRTLIWSVVILLGLGGAALAEVTAGARHPDEAGHCLQCHGQRGSIRQFPNGEYVSTHVDGDIFRRSVHGRLACSACHREFSVESHPQRTFRNKLQYQVRGARICRGCHTDEQLTRRPIHLSLLEKEQGGEALVCTTCHSAHAVTPVSGGSLAASEGNYCLGCHENENHMAFLNGESRSIRVDAKDLRGSPHRNLSCSDCHFGFSSEAHPKRRFRSDRDYVLASAEVCKRCHFDKYTKMTEGIHYAVLSVGDANAPTCTECHGGHATTSVNKDRLSTVRKCQSCHEDVYRTYAQSVHGNALFNEHNTDVPICIDCHAAHSTKDPHTAQFHEQTPDMCSGCHADEALMGKYGISTGVVKTYLSDFHGVTLSLYKLEGDKEYRHTRLAVCTDCHGIHDIARISGSVSSVVKGKLLARCRSCHHDASEAFPDAWLSHYEPSLSSAPAVFIVEASYKVLIPLMVAGLILQIFLHLWRYLVNR